MNIRGGWSMTIVFDSVCMLSLSKMQSRRSEVSFCNWIIFVCATHGMLKLNHLYLRIWLYWLLSECFLLLLPLKKLLVRSCFAWLVISYKGSFRNMNTVQKTCFNFYFFLLLLYPGDSIWEFRETLPYSLSMLWIQSVCIISAPYFQEHSLSGTMLSQRMNVWNYEFFFFNADFISVSFHSTDSWVVGMCSSQQCTNTMALYSTMHRNNTIVLR